MSILVQRINCYLLKLKKKLLNFSNLFIGKKMLGNPPQKAIFIEPNYYVVNNLDSRSIIVDIGTGDDANFSQDMIAKFNLRSFGFDPTRKHGESLKRVEINSGGKFTFYNFAISNIAGEAEFNESEDNVSGSFSVDHVNVKRDKINKYKVKTISMEDVINILDIPKIDLVKIDVEGEEFKIIKSLPKSAADKVCQFIVEFHHHCIDRFSIIDTYKAILRMNELGFMHYSVDGVNYLFYR